MWHIFLKKSRLLKKFYIYANRTQYLKKGDVEMKKLFAIILCAVIAFSFAACGAKSNDAAPNESGMAIAQDSAIKYTADEKFELYSNAAGGSGDVKAPASQNTQNEKIIKTVELSVETKEYEAYLKSLTASVSAAGGYVETSTTDLGSSTYSNRYATYTVRIPSANLDAFINAANEKGTVVSKTENQQNVTLEYVDLESRIEAYKTEKATLTGLLEKAASLENVLAIQERLSEVNYQIETYTSQLKVLENRVSYSTVTMRINEVERVTESKPTVWSRIKNRFLNNLDILADGFIDLVVTVVGGLPVIVPLGIGIFLAIIIIRKIIRKRRGY